MTGDKSKSIFLAVMGAPYESQLCTSVLRLIDEAVTAGHQLVVWTCGAATTLTCQAIGETKPRDLLAWADGRDETACPSTAALISALLTRSEGRLRWVVCRHCAQERGALEQMAGVVFSSPFRFVAMKDAADVALVVGVK